MSLKHGLLGFLNYGAQSGYELDKAFKDSLAFFWQAQTSQIYRELNRMEEKKWLTSEIIFQNDKPNKKMYTITQEGRDELLCWLREPGKTNSTKSNNTFLMKLFFSGELPIEENIRKLQDFIEETKQRLDAMSNIGSTVEEYTSQIPDPRKAFYWGLTAEYGRYEYEMRIQWARKMIERMEKMK